MKPCSGVLVAVILFASSFAIGQVAIGAPLFGTFGGGPFDVINLGNLNVHFAIPVLHKTGRGIPFNYDLIYDSSLWAPVKSSSLTETLQWTPAAGWGWIGGGESIYGALIVTPVVSVSASGNCTITTTTNSYSYEDAFATVHPFGGSTWTSVNSCGGASSSATLTVAATDGSGYKLNAPPSGSVTVTSKFGHQFSLSCSGSGPWAPCDATRIDPNGNQLTAQANGKFFDTLSSAIPVLTQTGSGTPTSPIKLTYTAPSGAAAAYILNFTTYTVATNFEVSGILEFGPLSENLISSINLPDGTSYTFAYEQTPGACTPVSGTYANCITGRLAQVTLPTGGSITYQYSGGTNGTGIFADGSTGSLSRTLNPGGTWKYQRALQDQPQPQASYVNYYTFKYSPDITTVTDPYGNESITTFSAFAHSQGVMDGIYSGAAWVAGEFVGFLPAPYYMTSQVVYQGSILDNKVLSAVTRTYDNGSIEPISGIQTTTQLNGITHLSHVTYNGGSGGSGLVDSDSESDILSDGSPTNQKQISVGYTILNSGSQIFYKPSSMQYSHTSSIGTQTIDAQTTYAYDQTAITTTSGTPQHSNGLALTSRGNLTTITRNTWRTSQPSLSSSYSYYDTGLVKTATDVNGAQSSFTYGNCGNSMLTKVTGPTGLTTQASWNCTGGVQLTATDANNKTASFAYTDPDFWRPSSATDAAGNIMSFVYSPAIGGAPSSMESSMLFNGSASTTDVFTSLDPFGRTLTVQEKQAPGSSTFDTVSYGYDLLGRLYFESLPYSAVAGQAISSGSGVSISYDALSRPVATTDTGGGFVNISYAGRNNDSLITSGPAPGCENPEQRQNEFDGLGRLTSVCEVTNATGSGSCGQRTGQTGFWTTYGYNSLDEITSVTQNAQAAAGLQQTRSFIYDGIGRLTSETNPESGTTTYTYDTDATCGTSNGDLVKKVDAVGNVTCIAYDTLHRPTQISYSGPYSASTPTKYFVYDSATVNGAAMANAKGRLAEAYTGTPSSKTTDVGFSYSVRGETTDVYQKTLRSVGYVHLSASYWANGAPHTVSGIPSATPLTYTYGLDGEGRTYSVSASSGQNPLLSTSYNSASQVTGLQYGSQDTDSFLYDPNTGRIINYQYQINGQTPVVGSLTWNPNGSLGVLAISDPFNSANSQVCSYTADDLGRTASTNCLGAVSQNPIWSQTFSYDPFGNISKNGSITFAAAYFPASNMIVGGNYDANGNSISVSGDQYSWDAGGNLATVNGIANTYDALGRLVEQLNGSTYTQTLYAPWGDKLALVSGGALTKAFIPLPGGAKAVYNNSGLAFYRHPDWLGTSRFASTPARTMYYSGAYAPFGESYSEAGTTDRSFTGQNQDTESGLYDFPTRSYNQAQGRWISPDKAGVAVVRPSNPQSWNRYAYVNNKPLVHVDRLGMDDGGDWGLIFSGGDDGGGYDGGDGGYGGGDGGYSGGPSGCDGSCGGGIGSGGGGGGRVMRMPPPPVPMYNEYLAYYNSSQSSQNFLASLIYGNFDPTIPDPTVPLVYNGDSQPDAANNATPWYETCTAQALFSGAGTIAIDAIGLIPEAEGFTKVFENTAGYQIARAVGNSAGYRGVVATQYGMKAVAHGKGAVAAISGAFGLGDTSVEGRISTGLTVLGFIPVLGTATAAASIGVDGYKTWKAISQCP